MGKHMMNINGRRRLQMAAVSLLICGLTGCGSSRPDQGRITGDVSLDGVPITDGRIQFEDVQGQASSAGGKIENGSYDVLSPVASMKVRIVAYREVPGKFIEMNPGVKTPFIEQYIPTKYNETSDLTVDIKPGSNTFDFKLIQ